MNSTLSGCIASYHELCHATLHGLKADEPNAEREITASEWLEMILSREQHGARFSPWVLLC
jgi:hypothetical protein